MAQRVEQVYMPAYTKNELRFGLFRRSFADKPHDIYAVYDEVADQFIVRLVNPSVFASEYYATDEIAFLVRDDNREVVGFTVTDFQSDFLPKVPKLNELWKNNNLADHLRTYRKGRYEPKSKKQRPQMNEQRIVTYSAFQSKAAAESELVMA
jgi:hypothetical protein